MKEKRKLLSYFFLLLFIAIIFGIGWIIGKYRFNNILTLPFSGSDNIVYEENKQKIINESYSNVMERSLLDPNLLGSLISCNSNSECTSNEDVPPPYQWIRYAEFAARSYQGPDTDFSYILEDLFTYTPEELDWKLFQYGDIILSDPIKYAKYKDRFIEVVTSLIHPYHFEDPYEFKYYTSDDPPPDDFLNGSALGYNGNYIPAIMDYSNDIMESAILYDLTKEEKYLYGVNEMLSIIHGVVMFENKMTYSAPSDLRYSSCYVILADVKAYLASGDTKYLSYFDHLIDKGDFDEVYGAKAKLDDIMVNTPMLSIPCLQAASLMVDNTPSGSVNDYENIENIMLEYFFENNLIEKNINSPLYGYFKLPDGRGDINSTAWFLNIYYTIQERERNE